ncbi:hypothetical protein GCM10009543_36300 [Leifsonia naganoensis]
MTTPVPSVLAYAGVATRAPAASPAPTIAAAALRHTLPFLIDIALPGRWKWDGSDGQSRNRDRRDSVSCVNVQKTRSGVDRSFEQTRAANPVRVTG